MVRNDLTRSNLVYEYLANIRLTIKHTNRTPECIRLSLFVSNSSNFLHRWQTENEKDVLTLIDSLIDRYLSRVVLQRC